MIAARDPRPHARVVHVITRLELGGAQQNTLDTVRQISRERYRVALIKGAPDYLDDDARAIPDLELHAVPELDRPIRPLLDLRALVTLTRILQRIRARDALPLIVHTHSSKAGILGRWAAALAGIRHVVHTYHGFGFHDEQPAMLRRSLIAAERATRRVTSAFVCVSDANRVKGARLGILTAARCELIRSGFDLGAFRRATTDPARIRREIGATPGTPLVGMVACFKPQKAPLDFVAAAAAIHDAVPDAHFVLAGDGELRPRVETAIQSAGLGAVTHLLGWRTDVADILAALDVSVLCSRWEGLPRVIPQALALGVPVVATAVDGVPEAIESGRTGILVPPGDPRQIARGVVELLGDPDRRRRMGDAGSRSVSAFDLHALVHAQERLYERLIATADAT